MYFGAYCGHPVYTRTLKQVKEGRRNELVLVLKGMPCLTVSNFFIYTTNLRFFKN